MAQDLLGRAVSAAAELDLARVPAPVLEHAGLVIADTLGVVMAGARTPEIEALVKLQLSEGLGVWPARSDPGSDRPARSSVLTSPRVEALPSTAAFLNATAGTFLELDEGMRPTGHPGMHVVPAALATAEARHSSGTELVRAVLAGYEVSARLFRAFRLRYPVHPHGHFGAVGAAVATAMLETDGDPVLAASIAGTTPLLPVWESCYDGASARNAYTGIAAEAGVRSSMLARAGLTGSPDALVSAFGGVAGELVDPEALTAPLDHEALAISRNYFKRHSCCALSHAALDAILQMDVPDPAEILDVRVETVQNNMKLDREPRPNSLSGRFSLPYSVATALVLGRTDPSAFEYRTDIAELARRVHMEVAPDLQEQWPECSPARVTVRTADGVTCTEVSNPRGHHSQPFAASELREKFLSLVGSGTDGERLWARLNALVEIDDCTSIFQRQAS